MTTTATKKIKRESEAQDICLFCQAPVKLEKQYTSTKVFEYQCEKCLNPGFHRTQVYNFSRECPICLHDSKEYRIIECLHFFCSECQITMTEKGQLTCPMCRQISRRFLRLKIQQPEFNGLCFESCDSIKRLVLRYHEKHGDPKRHTENHSFLLSVIPEYIRWLKIVSENPNGSKDLSPPSSIDSLWHLHLLDTEDYRNFCIKHTGKFVDHTLENSFLNMEDKRIENWKRTLYIVERDYKEKIPNESLSYVWGIDNVKNKNSEKENENYLKKIIVLNSFKTHLSVINVTNPDMTVSDLKFEIEKNVKNVRYGDFKLYFGMTDYCATYHPDFKPLKNILKQYTTFVEIIPLLRGC